QTVVMTLRSPEKKTVTWDSRFLLCRERRNGPAMWLHLCHVRKLQGLAKKNPEVVFKLTLTQAVLHRTTQDFQYESFHDPRPKDKN
ncbi:UNVERIFIED_CONTAM: hypothetical protein K2H54_031218, partial [Gekko kuhli]